MKRNLLAHFATVWLKQKNLHETNREGYIL